MTTMLALRPPDQFAAERLFGRMEGVHELPQLHDLAVTKPHEMRQHPLHGASGHAADAAGEQHDGGTLGFDHHGNRLAGDEFERLYGAVQRLGHGHLAATMPEKRKYLDRRIADELDVVVNGIEYEIELSLSDVRLNRHDPKEAK